MKEPLLINSLLNAEDYTRLLESLDNPKSFGFDPGFSRYCIGDGGLPILAELANKLTETAREVFNSEALMPTYTLFAHYEGNSPSPSLYKHKDDNACTYTIDMCVYQKEPWDLFVEDKAKDFTKKVIYMIKSKKQNMLIGKNGQKYVRRYHNWKILNKIFIDLLKN